MHFSSVIVPTYSVTGGALRFFSSREAHRHSQGDAGTAETERFQVEIGDQLCSFLERKDRCFGELSGGIPSGQTGFSAVGGCV